MFKNLTRGFKIKQSNPQSIIYIITIHPGMLPVQ